MKNLKKTYIIGAVTVLWYLVPGLVAGFEFTSESLNISDVSPQSTQIEILPDSTHEREFPEESDLYDSRMAETKTLFADAIIADVSGDTLEAVYLFELVFEALSELKDVTVADEFQYLEFNRMLTAAIDYYENDAETISSADNGLSVSILRDKLNEFIYNQTLDDLEYVEESVEIIPGHVPITYNRKVASIIKFYQTKGRQSVQKWLDRMDRYKSIILPILEEEQVPPEIFYLAMIESGLKPDAYSHKYASGLWQFVKSTGKLYGLNSTWWVDERNDFEKSTHAAARHMKDLYAEFGDWYLAFAAYNSGAGTVKRAIKRNHTRDYWKLTRLPRETRNYVPNIMAAIYISNNPEKWGFRVDPEPVLSWQEVEIDKPVKLDVIAKCSGLGVKTLLQYNPE
ncbi:MAG: lytic transglycosylase domain-containing protein, partial [FCB group bacterium]|nr:lytic transglycosylase domain-containing protein [FCB group bacterium]